MRLGITATALCLVLVITAGSIYAQSLEEVLGVRSSTTVDGAKSQAKVDQIADDTADLLSQYKRTMKVVDGLRAHNELQRRLIRKQERKLIQLAKSIDEATVIQRQISPLTSRMIDNLEKFIEMDVPFLLKERRDRIVFLRETLNREDVTVAEKFSQVLQAYQVENTYGTTIEAYTDVIELEPGQPRQVDVLKWGRVALVFQTLDGDVTGAWDNNIKSWVILSDSYRRGVRDGIRIARKTQTADLVLLPVQSPAELMPRTSALEPLDPGLSGAEELVATRGSGE